MAAATAPPAHDIDPAIFARRWWTLAALCTSLIIVIVGNTALNVALPTLSEDLGASQTQLQWMVDSYSLVFAGFLLTAGALGDRFGRKGALQLGLLVFLGGSVAAAFSDSADAVVGMRAVMGLGAALVMPATLSILTNVFPAHERARAIAIWAGISGGGAALGPVASGFVLEHFWWGAVFLVNVPVILGALIAGRFLLPKSKDPGHTALDPVGAVLSILGLSALVYAIIEAPNHGWMSTESALWFGAAVVILAAFALWERRQRHPMLDLTLFEDRRFAVSSGGITLVFFAMFGMMFLLTQFLQLVLGYTPLEAGLRQLPISFVMMGLAPQTPRLVQRFGANRVAGGGLMAIAGGLVLFSTLGVGTTYWQLLAPMVVLAAGMALTMSPMTTQIMSAVPREKAGVGSAMNDTTRELGGALGVAVLGSLVTSQYASQIVDAAAGLPTAARTAAESSLAGAVAVSQQLPEGGAELLRSAQQAFVDGMGVASLVGAAVAFLASLAVFKLLPADPMATGAHDESRPGHLRPPEVDVVGDDELPPAALAMTAEEAPPVLDVANEISGDEGRKVPDVV
jgi:EmrB/QacA subfamily drug resistance transporter